MGILDKIIQVDKYNNIGLLGMTDEFFVLILIKCLMSLSLVF